MKIIIMFVLSAISLNVEGQTIIFEGHTSGNPFTRTIDSVVFGFSEGASLGVDPAFGEENIKSTPVDSLELRIFQRSELNFDCLTDTCNQNIYFLNDLEMRKDIRSLKSTGNECYFEVVNLTNNFAGGYLINLTKYHKPSRKSEYFGMKTVSECGTDTFQYHNLLRDVGSTYIYIILVLPRYAVDTGYRYLKYFYFHLKPDDSVNVTEEDSEESLIKAYPNPANNYISIECEEALEIIDIKGNILFSFPRHNEKIIVDLSLLPIGTYIISKTSSLDRIKSTTKFIKI